MTYLTGGGAFATLIILMGISGLMSSTVWANDLSLVHTVLSPDKDTTILGFWATCPNFGNIIGFVVMQCIVLNNGLSWQLGQYVIALYMILNALYICIRVDELPN